MPHPEQLDLPIKRSESSVALFEQINGSMRRSESFAIQATDELRREIAELRQQHASDRVQFQRSLDAQHERFEGLQESLRRNSRMSRVISVISTKSEEGEDLMEISTKEEPELEEQENENMVGLDDHDSMYDA